MRLRDLELKDAPLMLEWMHDENVVEKLRGKFKEKTIEDCKSFIKENGVKACETYQSINNSGKTAHIAK